MPVALGIATDPAPGIELETFDQLVASSPVLAALETPHQVDALAAREPGPQDGVAGNVGDVLVDQWGGAPGVGPEHCGPAAVQADLTQKGPDRGRLSRAVRPEETVHGASLDPQVEACERLDAAETLGRILQHNGKVSFN